MMNFPFKNILLGITGSIAAYKSIELIRRLREQGATVKVVLTCAGAAFVTPLTLQAVAGGKVYQDLLNADNELQFSHLDLARWAEVILIAPASADFLAKLSHGMADDLLSTVCLASDAPLKVAPAMNQQMWAAAATQANIALLRQRGAQFLGPAQGVQACGETGLGRLLEPADIVAQLQSSTGLLAHLHIMVTAGATREAIDPVRFISNRSSGRMGFAIAQAAQQWGARVTLVSGVVALPTPFGVQRLDCISAQDMHNTVQQHIAGVAVFIATAAVADYRPATQATEKIKKNTAMLTLTLERSPDILAMVARLQPKPFCVGFAAETQNLRDHALQKLHNKNLDMVAANWVNQADIGFDSLNNALQVFWRGGEQILPKTDKLTLARQLLTLVKQRYGCATGTR
jgi:phosphopantothenoylcysteine decarboxylase/phosphopantothenate--cysteine ligase